jgi:hypothetical protein
VSNCEHTYLCGQCERAVLYRFFDKGTVTTRKFATGTIEIGGPVDPRRRILTLTLTAEPDCLPGEWSILNESSYQQLDCFGDLSCSSTATAGPDSFAAHVPAPLKRGKMTLRFLVRFKEATITPPTGPGPTSFCLYMFCHRANPDCRVCPRTNDPRPFLRLNGSFIFSPPPGPQELANINIAPISSLDDYFPTSNGSGLGELPPLPYPCCQRLDVSSMPLLGPRGEYPMTLDPNDETRRTPWGNSVRR